MQTIRKDKMKNVVYFLNCHVNNFLKIKGGYPQHLITLWISQIATFYPQFCKKTS